MSIRSSYYHLLDDLIVVVGPFLFVCLVCFGFFWICFLFYFGTDKITPSSTAQHPQQVPPFVFRIGHTHAHFNVGSFHVDPHFLADHFQFVIQITNFVFVLVTVRVFFLVAGHETFPSKFVAHFLQRALFGLLGWLAHLLGDGSVLWCFGSINVPTFFPTLFPVFPLFGLLSCAPLCSAFTLRRVLSGGCFSRFFGIVGKRYCTRIVGSTAATVATIAAAAVAVAAVAAVAAAATATRLSHFTSKIFWLGIVYPRHLLKPCGDFDFQLTHFVVVVVVVVVLVSTVVR